MNNEVKQRNLRQIKLIKKKVESYLRKEIHISWLLDDLHALAYEIQHPPAYFMKSFIEEWANIEIPYASIISDGRKTFTPEERLRIDKALQKILKLIEKLQNDQHKNTSD